MSTITHMPFGKHRGELLDAIPRDYFNWLLEQDWMLKRRWEDLVESIEEQLNVRDRSYDKH